MATENGRFKINCYGTWSSKGRQLIGPLSHKFNFAAQSSIEPVALFTTFINILRSSNISCKNWPRQTEFDIKDGAEEILKCFTQLPLFVAVRTEVYIFFYLKA